MGGRTFEDVKKYLDIFIKDQICNELQLTAFDERAMQSKILQIKITSNCRVEVQPSFEMNLHL